MCISVSLYSFVSSCPSFRPCVILDQQPAQSSSPQENHGETGSGHEGLQSEPVHSFGAQRWTGAAAAVAELNVHVVVVPMKSRRVRPAPTLEPIGQRQR